MSDVHQNLGNLFRYLGTTLLKEQSVEEVRFWSPGYISEIYLLLEPRLTCGITWTDNVPNA